jgi:GT2 family glycosyltransferase
MKDITDIDIIILSYAQSEALKAITEECIDSLKASEDPEKIRFNIIVIETERNNKPFQYPGTTTVYPDEEFGYNRYMNIGIEMSSAKYVCLCNNDLIFNPSWATEILKAFNKYYGLSSASPACSLHHPKMGFELNNGIYPGYRNHFEVAGWCLFMKREVLEVTGKLDENYKFWCADNDYANTLSALRIGHALISSSIVNHLEHQTINSIQIGDEQELTANEFFYFEKKWNYRMDSDRWSVLP